jgi:nitric oxide reductase subunit C
MSENAPGINFTVVLKPLNVFILLCTAFAVYTVTIYMMPAAGREAGRDAGTDAAKGRLVWQKYNCQACHQLYGLGGYLGPDLTNLCSSPGKSEIYVNAIIKSGSATMPAFTLSDEEHALLFAFLQAVDRSGSGDPRTLELKADGMTAIHEN